MAMTQGLDFEKPIIELEGKLNELKGLSTGDVNITEEIQKLETKLGRLVKQTYAKLTPAQKVQVARHPARPHTSDYLSQLFTEFAALRRSGLCRGHRHYRRAGAFSRPLLRRHGP